MKAVSLKCCFLVRNNLIIALFVLGALLLSTTSYGFSASLRLKSIQRPKSPITRLIFTSNAPIHVHAFALIKPERYVFDFKNAHLLGAVPSKKPISGQIRQIRHAKINTADYRFVLDLCSDTQVQYDLSHDQKTLTVDVQATILNKKLNIDNVIQKIITHPILPRKRSSQVIIVIDPGHGGKDPGAIGVHHIKEKNVVLAIAKKLRAIMNRTPGYRAVLTRSEDIYLPLRKRLDIARQYHADMFVAIHADAYRNHQAHGASVFALSRRGATSEAAHWLAARENQSELMGGVKLFNKDHLLQSVLINLSQTATIRASLVIGQALIKALDDFADLHHKTVEQAAFVVLKSPDIPSLLVETGFLSNRTEARRLSQSSYQSRIAKAISTGIIEYFHKRPPRGTWLAQQSGH